MQFSKIDFLMPVTSQYGVLHYFTKKMYEALHRRGVSCRLLEGEQMIDLPCKDPPDLTIGFNGIPSHSSGVFLCDLIERPHLCCLMDLSYRFFYLVQSPLISFTCNDRFSLELLNLKHVQNCFFMPPAVEKEAILSLEKKREYEVVFLATYIDFESRREKWKQYFPKSICEIMDETIEMTFCNTQFSFIETFQKVLNVYLEQDKIHDDDQIDLFSIWEQLELYIRGKDRVDLIQSIQDATVHIFDASIDQKNWKHHLKGKSNLIFHEPVSYEESLAVMRKSKIVLNSSPHLRNGVHERVLNALACGALPVTEENPYLLENFPGQLLFYKNSERDQLNQLINDYLNNENKRLDICTRGKENVLFNHTWDCRISKILENLNFS